MNYGVKTKTIRFLKIKIQLNKEQLRYVTRRTFVTCCKKN